MRFHNTGLAFLERARWNEAAVVRQVALSLGKELQPLS